MKKRKSRHLYIRNFKRSGTMKKILCFMITLAIFMSGISVISYGAGEPDIKVSPRLINAGENEALVYDITCLYDLGTYNKNLKLL